MSIGKQLKSVRLKAGMTQVQLSKASGVSQASIALYENDQQTPVADKLAALARALNVPMEALVDSTSEEPVSTSPDLDRRQHGNSTVAQIHKIVQQLGLESQRDILKQARLLLTVQTAEQTKDDHKRPRKVA